MKTFFKFTSIVCLLCAFALLGATPTRAASHNTASHHSIIFSANVPGDEFWDDRFGVPNVVGTVNAIVTNSDDVYVGGTFTYADGIVANNIALWDGTQTFALGTGISGDNGTQGSTKVNALALQGNNLFVGGNFNSADGVAVKSLAMWNGSEWSDVGGGVNGIVNAIAVNGSDVYVGGLFGFAGSTIVNHIARWDGTEWHALGNGIYGNGNVVNTIAIQDNVVYIGGVFSQAGDVAARNVARWDGATWSAVDGELYGSVLTLAFQNQVLYAGGHFNGGCLAQWDGTNWSVSNDLCLQMPIPITFAWIQSLVVWNGKLHALVRSSFADFGILAWLENAEWKIGPGGTFNSMVTLGAGNFVYVGGQGIHAWDDQNWYPLFNGNAKGLDGIASALAADGDSIYVGGFFELAGNVSAHHIARWDGVNWSALGDELDGIVRALVMYNNDLVVGGDFTHAGNLPVNHLARWNGSAWSSVGDGVNGPVYALAPDGNDLIVGGDFDQAGGTDANNIAKWNGATWSGLASGTNGNVYAIAVNNDGVYAGGMFDRAGHVAAQNIARWNGQGWFALDSGVNKSVSTMVADGNTLYVGGTFTKAGNNTAKHIARWNGKRWSALGKGVDSYVHTLALLNGALFVGGSFSQAGQVHGYGIAKWDGSRWSALGSDTDGAVYATTRKGSDIMIAGTFQTAGNKPASSFSIWHDPSPARVTLVAPTNGQTFVKRKILLDWSDSPDATSYAAEIRKQANKSNIVKTATNVSEFRTPSLERGLRYSWRVQACTWVNGTDYCSAWTPWWNFTVQEKTP